MPNVTFAMEWVPQYRVPFYAALRQRLADNGVEMQLIHGDPPANRKGRRDHQSLPWAQVVPNRFFTVAGLGLTWQPVWRRLKQSELIVLQQETGLLINYPALMRSKLGGTPVALWGHGHNFNPEDASAPAEWVKSKVTRLADWIFAYTETSAEVFRSLGIDDARITVVQNSMEAAAPQPDAGPVSDEVAQLVSDVAGRSSRVGWIVSALDRWKRVPFLLEVLDATRARVENFEFFALGAGAEAEILAEAARTRPWLHVVGPVFGADKAAIGALAEVTIQPGLVGLHVIDTFATATPMITADISYHSHEASYLEPEINAVVLPAKASAEDFAASVAEVFEDDTRLASLRQHCRASAEVYTLEAMVERFAQGVISALALR